MKVQVSKKSFLSLESVAMTDIVMNLFIFFFISFSLLYTFNPDKESKIEVKLPEGAVSKEGKMDEPLIISITAGNEIYVGGTRVLPDAIKKEIEKVSASKKKSGVLVKSDKSASVDYLVKALDAAKQSGIQKLGVAIQQESK